MHYLELILLDETVLMTFAINPLKALDTKLYCQE